VWGFSSQVGECAAAPRRSRNAFGTRRDPRWVFALVSELGQTGLEPRSAATTTKLPT